MTFTRFALPAVTFASAFAATMAPTVADAQAQHYSAHSDDANGPQKLVDKAASVVREMERDPKLRGLMQRAEGLYIIPEYGRGGFIIGGKGGAGVVVARNRSGEWSSPAFFNTGGLSVGLQIGAAGGSIVYLLMDRKAIDAFRSHNKVSFDVHAGYSIVKYSDAMQASSVKHDAIMWTNIKGAYAGATIGATDVGVDSKRTREFYGREVGVSTLLDGRVTAPGAQALDRVLPH